MNTNTFRNVTPFGARLIAAFAKAAEIGAISKDGKRKKVAKGKWEWISKIGAQRVGAPKSALKMQGEAGKSGVAKRVKKVKAATADDAEQPEFTKPGAVKSPKPAAAPAALATPPQAHSEPPPDAAKHWGSKAQPFYRPGPNPTVDTVVTRDGPNGKKQVLLIQRATANKHGEPVAEGGKWAIPGGFHDSDSQRGQPWKPGKETAQQAAMRELTEETGLDASMVAKSLRHTGKYGDESKPTGRDPRDNKEAWSVSNAFTMHLPKELAGKPIKGLDDASNAKWFDVDEAGKLPLAFDHSRILGDAMKGAASETPKSKPAAPPVKPTAAPAPTAKTSGGAKSISVSAGMKIMRDAGLSDTQIRILESKAGKFKTDKKGRPVAGKREFDSDELAQAIKNIKWDEQAPAQAIKAKPKPKPKPKGTGSFGARLVAVFRKVPA